MYDEWSALIGRVLDAWDSHAFRVDDLGHLPEPVSRAIRDIGERLESDDESDALRARVCRFEALGVFSPPRAHSVRAVIDLHPRRRDVARARRAIVAMERALVDEVDPDEKARGREASDRLRGTAAFFEGRYETALEHYLGALRQRPAATNLANVMAALIRLDQVAEARRLLERARTDTPEAVRGRLDARVMADPDLAILRLPVPSAREVA